MRRKLLVDQKFARPVSLGLFASLAVLLPLALFMRFPGLDQAGTIHVPGDYATIQSAVNAAQNGDVILVSPGTYREALRISGKTITLASEFYTSGDLSLVSQTVIDGGGNTVITVDSTVGPEAQIIGFTIRNGEDGIATRAKMNILNNHILNTTDGIDSTGGGGLIKSNTFENNRDDGVDFDQASSGIIENNLIRSNGNDGIEIRLHDYTGPELSIVIRGNIIEGNTQDGIQLIDYPSVTNRVFTIERNLFHMNKMAAIGLMDDGKSREDFRASSIPERIFVFNNTFIDNPYAISGGDNLIALNNIFTGAATMALKNVDNGSIVAYNLFWNNAADEQGSNLDGDTTRYSDPILDENYALQPGSPGIDAGTALFVWNGETVLSYPPGSFNGSNPDLGWRESASESPTPTPTEPPNPSTPMPGQQPVTKTFILIWNGETDH